MGGFGGTFQPQGQAFGGMNNFGGGFAGGGGGYQGQGQ